MGFPWRFLGALEIVHGTMEGKRKQWPCGPGEPNGIFLRELTSSLATVPVKGLSILGIRSFKHDGGL